MALVENLVLFAVLSFGLYGLFSVGDGHLVSRLTVPDDEEDRDLQIEEDTSWPGLTQLGQVSAVDVDKEGKVHIFHRGPRVWDFNTFDDNNNLRNKEDGPIVNDTIAIVDPQTGKIIRSWGANQFYMPHGLTVDGKGNTWVTDVGLHQVMKFPSGLSEPSLTIGEALKPGSDTHHLCKPSDVAVLRSGYFFISDGYCNSRILMFSPAGRLMQEIGAKDEMRVPHSLTLLPNYGAVCVADRENRRILCYSMGMDGNKVGVPLAEFEGRGIGRVFGIGRRGDQIFAINGQDNSESAFRSHGVVIDIDSGEPTSLWGPENGFSGPHDLAFSPDGSYVYVAELDTTAPKRVYRFKIED